MFASYRVPIYTSTPGWRAAVWIKCLAERQKHLALIGTEPTTLWSRVKGSIQWAPYMYILCFCCSDATSASGHQTSSPGEESAGHPRRWTHPTQVPGGGLPPSQRSLVPRWSTHPGIHGSGGEIFPPLHPKGYPGFFLRGCFSWQAKKERKKGPHILMVQTVQSDKQKKKKKKNKGPHIPD